MSSEFVVQALPVTQPSAQGAIARKSKVASVTALAASSAQESPKGKELPSKGDDVPSASPFADSSNQPSSLNNEEVLEAVQNLNDYVQNTKRELNFSVDEQTGKTVVKVIDFETKKLIRQIPADEILHLAQRIAEENEEKGNLLAIEV